MSALSDMDPAERARYLEAVHQRPSQPRTTADDEAEAWAHLRELADALRRHNEDDEEGVA